MQQNILTISNLTVTLQDGKELLYAIDGLEFSIPKGKTFALVGESGCGKSMAAHTIVRLLPDSATLYAGSEVNFEEHPLLRYSEKQMQSIRGHRVGIVFQDPMAALNPVLSIRSQLEGALHLGDNLSKAEKRIKLIDLLTSVRIPDPERILSNYPHQLSGGMKQRVMIAMALANEPELLIADEPTTALDVTTQAQILSLLKEIQKTRQMSMLLITHDLGVVAQMADKIAVMYAGHIVEETWVEDFFKSPRHPYSIKLLSALPEKTDRNSMLSIIPGLVPHLHKSEPLCRFRDRCQSVKPICHTTHPKNSIIHDYGAVRCHAYDAEISELSRPIIVTPPKESFIEPYESEQSDPLLIVENLKVHFPIKSGFFKRTTGYLKAVDDISFSLLQGKTLALVGESGCGKTTAGKAIAHLIPSTDGRIVYWGKNLNALSEKKIRGFRGDLQIIFQDPFSSMDPKMSIDEIIEEGMKALKIGSNAQERNERIDNLLSQVGLPSAIKHRYPHELSGGQRQRVAIARALAVNPKMIICDEPTSALDVSVQAQILNLLKTLQNEYEIAYLFITHNIGVVRYIADRVAVMYLGRIVEQGPIEDVLNAPKHPYTQALLDSVPSVDKAELRGVTKGDVPSLLHPPSGCHFHPRCPLAMPICRTDYPPDYKISSNHEAKCYLYNDLPLLTQT